MEVVDVQFLWEGFGRDSGCPRPVFACGLNFCSATGSMVRWICMSYILLLVNMIIVIVITILFIYIYIFDMVLILHHVITGSDEISDMAFQRLDDPPRCAGFHSDLEIKMPLCSLVKAFVEAVCNAADIPPFEYLRCIGV